MMLSNDIIRNNKESNARFWKMIDSEIIDMIAHVKTLSLSDVNYSKQDSLDDGLVSEIRDIVIKKLEEKGGEYPKIN